MQKSTGKEIDNGRTYRAIVIGASAGGRDALEKILSGLPADYALPILIAQHLPSDDGGTFAQSLGRKTQLSVVSPCDKKKFEPGYAYVAPANYHMLVERSGHTALSTEEKVKWSRPSIDVLFESAAYVWGEKVIAILLTGSNDDGAEGMRTVRAHGGLTIVQDPSTAEHPVMPQAAINAKASEKVMTLEEISEFLARLLTGPFVWGSNDLGTVTARHRPFRRKGIESKTKNPDRG